MFVNLGQIDLHVKDHTAELLREVENDRLVRLALGPGRPFRFRIAAHLRTVAERLEGAPRGTVVGAEA
jgi:hypothetical protein